MLSGELERAKKPEICAFYPIPNFPSMANTLLKSAPPSPTPSLLTKVPPMVDR
jgi:hypothetical protein